MTFICADNAHSAEVRAALEALGDKTRTDLMIGEGPADVRVLQIVTKTVTAADELEVYAKAERRYAPVVEIAEDWNCEIEAADTPEESTDDDQPDAAPVAERLSEDEIALAVERGDIVEPDPLSPDAVAQGNVDDEDEYDLQSTLQDLGPELLEIARDRGWATSDPLSPDFVDSPPPLTESEKTRLAGLVAEAIESSGASQKQWYLWEIARQAGFEHLVRGIFNASGYDPIQFDDADFMGVAPGAVGLPTVDESGDSSGPMTVGDLIAQLQRFDPDALIVHSKDDEGNAYRIGVDLSEGRGSIEERHVKRDDDSSYTWHEFNPLDDDEADDDDLYFVYVYPG